MGSRSSISKEHKLALLAMIKEKKEVLFGKFSSELDNRRKKEAWGEVLLKAQSLQIVTAGRDANYVRDKLFGVWKTRALEKRDNRKRTGQGGGKDRLLNEVDWAVIDIIGKESPIVEGLPIGETGNPVPALENDVTLSGIGEEYAVPGEFVTTVRSAQKRKRVGVKTDSLSEQKRPKDELIELQIYKTRLEALQMERELNLPPSSYTKDIDFRPVTSFEVSLNEEA